MLNDNAGLIFASLSRASQSESGDWLRLSSQNDTSFTGTLQIGMATEDDAFEWLLEHELGSPQDTTQGAIVDIRLDASQADALATGRMAFRLLSPTPDSNRRHPGVTTTLFLEQDFVANTDQRSIYSDAGGTRPLDNVTIAVTHRGQPAPEGTAVLVAKYRHLPSPVVPPMIVSQSDAEQLVELTDSAGQSIEQPVPFTSASGGDGETLAAIVHTDAQGMAHLSVRSLNDGFAVLLFLPFSGDTPPLPTGTISPANAGYACLRIWPDDTADQEAFVELWNSTIGQGREAVRHAAWKYVYENILYLYDLLFPVMLLLPLYELDKIEARIDAFKQVVDVAFDDTRLMPVTRDLSTGKHWVLRKWAELVQAGYPLDPIRVDA